MPTPFGASATATATLIAREIGVDIAGTTALHDVSVTITPSTCLGVVGPNGAGKSTLLRVLAGITPPDRGVRRLDPPAATVGLLAQEEAPSGETVRQMLLRRTGVAGAEAALESAAGGLAAGSPQAADRYALALDRLTALAGGDIDARIDAVAGELGIAGAVDRPTAQLSGGQASKASLAAVMLSRFDITLLDEPTNDLDFAGLARLESFVNGRHGAMVVVSHDRDFLNRTINSVLELDGHDRTARHFGGGWSAYLAERLTAQRHAGEAFTRYESRRDTLTSRAQREREWATRGVRREKKATDGDRAQRGFRMNRTEQLASRARRTERALESLAPVAKPWESWELRFTIEQAERAGAVVVRLDAAVVERDDFVLGPVTVEISWAQRIALTGPNGSGKSTLVGALVGRIPLTRGTRWIGPSVVIGELGQDRTSLASSRSVAESVQARCGLTDADTRSLLAKFGLGANEVGRPSSSLSPGERTRAELATFQGLGVNFLVLDEPTNHLDLEAIEQLESALDGFTGTLLLVSHDRRLLEAVETTRTIELPLSDPSSP